jgi:hypothetical protein
MFLAQVALASETQRVDFAELAKVSAALQKQAMRDLAPVWDVRATVDPFASLDDVPLGYWRIVVADEIPYRAAGIHLDQDGQPYALVRWDPEWSLTASHELVEMLVDPFGNRLIAGPSPHPDQGRVEFLVEVADPSESAEFGYTANGILVSDFYTERFFDPVESRGVQYSYTGAITRPRQILKGGYISWHEPVTDEWWQQTWFSGSEPAFVRLGRINEKNRMGSLRATIDALTVGMQQERKVGPFSPTGGFPRVGQAMAAAVEDRVGPAAATPGTLQSSGRSMRGLSPAIIHESTSSKGESLRQQIRALVKSAGSATPPPKKAAGRRRKPRRK